VNPILARVPLMAVHRCPGSVHVPLVAGTRGSRAACSDPGCWVLASAPPCGVEQPSGHVRESLWHSCRSNRGNAGTPVVVDLSMLLDRATYSPHDRVAHAVRSNRWPPPAASTVATSAFKCDRALAVSPVAAYASARINSFSA